MCGKMHRMTRWIFSPKPASLRSTPHLFKPITFQSRNFSLHFPLSKPKSPKPKTKQKPKQSNPNNKTEQQSIPPPPSPFTQHWNKFVTIFKWIVWFALVITPLVKYTDYMFCGTHHVDVFFIPANLPFCLCVAGALSLFQRTPIFNGIGLLLGGLFGINYMNETHFRLEGSKEYFKPLVGEGAHSPHAYQFLIRFLDRYNSEQKRGARIVNKMFEVVENYYRWLNIMERCETIDFHTGGKDGEIDVERLADSLMSFNDRERHILDAVFIHRVPKELEQVFLDTVFEIYYKTDPSLIRALSNREFLKRQEDEQDGKTTNAIKDPSITDYLSFKQTRAKTKVNWWVSGYWRRDMFNLNKAHDEIYQDIERKRVDLQEYFRERYFELKRAEREHGALRGEEGHDQGWLDWFWKK